MHIFQLIYTHNRIHNVYNSIMKPWMHIFFKVYYLHSKFAMIQKKSEDAIACIFCTIVLKIYQWKINDKKNFSTQLYREREKDRERKKERKTERDRDRDRKRELEKEREKERES